MVFAVGEYAVLTIIYSFIAFVLVEALLRFWGIRQPAAIIKFRLLILALPPALAVLAEFAQQERRSFLVAHGLVLLESEKWLSLFGGNDVVAWLIFGLVAVSGAAVFVYQTVLPFWRHHRAWRAGQHTGKVQDALQFPELQRALANLAQVLPALPPLQVWDESEPAAYVYGLRCPTIFISRSLISLLDEEELEAVLAHETSHIRGGDARLSWVVIFLRAILFFNPVTALTFNQIALDIERACDESGVALTGKPLAFAAALLKVYRATSLPGAGNWSGLRYYQVGQRGYVSFRLAAWENHARRAFTEARVKRITEDIPSPSTSRLRLRLALVALGAISLMVMVL